MLYLKERTNICLVYGITSIQNNGLVGYGGLDHGGDLMKRRSLTYYIFTLFRYAISWKLALQPTIALSTTETKYMLMKKE